MSDWEGDQGREWKEARAHRRPEGEEGVVLR